MSLKPDDTIRVVAAIDSLAQTGPSLGRPLVDTIKMSRHPRMKELRPATSLRILFAFDQRRAAILLIGGDKRGQWSDWYRVMVPLADALYDDHLETLRRDGLL